MKKIIIFTMLLLVSFTMASTSETFAFEIFNPEDEDDPYTTQSDDIVFEGGGGGTINRSITQSDNISDYDWPTNIDAENFDYTNTNYNMYDATVYNDKLFIPLVGSETEVDQCSDLSGNWLRTAETYRVSSRYMGISSYYHSIGETGDFSVGDYYYYDLDNGTHEVYEKYDVCQKYDVIDMTTSLSSGNYFHWSSVDINPYTELGKLITRYYDIYLLETDLILQVAIDIIQDYQDATNNKFYNILENAIYVAGTALTVDGLLSTQIPLPPAVKAATWTVAALSGYTRVLSMKLDMIANNYETIEDYVQMVDTDTLPQYTKYILIKDSILDLGLYNVTNEADVYQYYTSSNSINIQDEFYNGLVIGNIAKDSSNYNTYSEIYAMIIQNINYNIINGSPNN